MPGDIVFVASDGRLVICVYIAWLVRTESADGPSFYDSPHRRNEEDRYERNRLRLHVDIGLPHRLRPQTPLLLSLRSTVVFPLPLLLCSIHWNTDTEDSAWFCLAHNIPRTQAQQLYSEYSLIENMQITRINLLIFFLYYFCFSFFIVSYRTLLFQ